MSTRNLKTLLVELLQQYHLLTVEQMLAKLEQTNRIFNKTSLYRALDQLVGQNTICKHYFDNDQAVYELSNHHHAHLLCQDCGLVTETDCQLPQSSMNTIEGFKVDHHHLTFVGLCAACQTKMR
jgi:Fur family ferric uptake transcriptional regulator